MKKRFNISAWQSRNRTYIVPSTPGLIFFALIPCVFIVGAIFNQDWTYLFGFTLLTVFLVGMFQTNSNLNSLEILKVEVQSNVVGKKIEIECAITNKQKIESLAVGLECVIDNAKTSKLIDILEGSSVHYLSFQALTRGVYKLSPIRIYTRFPVGLFYSWRQKDFEKTYFVYPEPKGQSLLDRRTLDFAEGFNKNSEEEEIELKLFQEGDSLNHVDWKSYARGAPLSIKIYRKNNKLYFDLDWFQLGNMDLESKISQLALWVNECHQAGWIYNLLLPNKKINFSSEAGDHYDLCMRELSSIEGAHGEA